MNNRIYQWVVSNWDIPLCGILLSLLLLLHITSLRHKGLTTDELLHYQYGDRVLHSSPRRTGATDSSTMPFSALHAMTSQSLAIVANNSGLSMDKSWIAQIKRGRYATIALSLILAAYVFTWSYQLHGRQAALLSLGLYVFDPNLLAHGQLVTADLPATLMTTMALYHFWYFLKFGGKGRALLSAVTLGRSQLAKYSCVYLYPIFLGDCCDLSLVCASSRRSDSQVPMPSLGAAPLAHGHDVLRCGKHRDNQSWIHWPRLFDVNAVISGGVRFTSPDVNAPAETVAAIRWLCVPE